MFFSFLKSRAKTKDLPVANCDPAPTNWCGQIKVGADALRKRRDVWGQTLRFPNGESLISDNCLAVLVKKADGRIHKTFDRFGRQSNYSYNNSGQLATLDLPDGKRFARGPQGSFVELASGLEKESPGFELLRDGTLRIEYLRASGKRHFRQIGLDGTIAIIAQSGRTISLKCDRDTQRRRLLNALANLVRAGFIDDRRLHNFKSSIAAFNRRGLMGEITEAEAAKTFYQLARLLEADNSKVGQVSRCLIAHEFIFSAAFPTAIKAVDGLASLVRELVTQHPSCAASIITDMCLKGNFITRDDIRICINSDLLDPLSCEPAQWTSINLKQRQAFLWSLKLLRTAILLLLEQTRLRNKCANAPLRFDPPLIDEEDGQLYLQPTRQMRTRINTSAFGKIKLGELFAIYGQLAKADRSAIALYVDPPLEDLHAHLSGPTTRLIARPPQTKQTVH